MLVHVIITYNVKMEDGGHPSTMWVEAEANLNVTTCEVVLQDKNSNVRLIDSWLFMGRDYEEQWTATAGKKTLSTPWLIHFGLRHV